MKLPQGTKLGRLLRNRARLIWCSLRTERLPGFKISPHHCPPHLLRLAFHLTFPIWLNASLLSFLSEGKVIWSLRDTPTLWI